MLPSMRRERSPVEDTATSLIAESEVVGNRLARFGTSEEQATLAEIAAEVSGLTRGERTWGRMVNEYFLDACLLSRKLLQSTTAPAPARALLQSTLGRTPTRFWRQCWSASALEEGSSTALLQSTQTALFHASTTRSTAAACARKRCCRATLASKDQSTTSHRTDKSTTS